MNNSPAKARNQGVFVWATSTVEKVPHCVACDEFGFRNNQMGGMCLSALEEVEEEGGLI